MLENAVTNPVTGQKTDCGRLPVSESTNVGEAAGLGTRSIGRDQILGRLWQLANLSPEQTRGSITGQMKAMSLIVAIEGLIPSRRPEPKASPATVTTTETKPGAPGPGCTSQANPFVHTKAANPVPARIGDAYGVHIGDPGSLRLPNLTRKARALR
jgi:hypothetical protein